MRDLLFNVIYFSLVPFAIMRPHLGALFYVCLSLLNPQNLIYNTYQFDSYALVIALATGAGMLIRFQEIRFRTNLILTLMLMLLASFTISSFFSLNPAGAWDKWVEILKIYFIVIVLFLLIVDVDRFRLLLWVISLSIGYFGFRGGLKTIVTGGTSMVYGDPLSALGDNNTLAMAELIVIPMMIALGKTVGGNHRKWKKSLLFLLAGLTFVSVLGSWSRGALVGFVTLILILWLHNRNRVVSGLAILFSGMLILGFAPEDWTNRMKSIKTYRDDDSAMARVHGPRVAWEIAMEHPLTGGGFALASTDYFKEKNPEAGTVDIHNSFFQLLSEHGFVSFSIFCSLFVASTWKLYRSRKLFPSTDDRRVYADHLLMSLIPFIICGSFMPRAYLELLYIQLGTVAIFCNVFLDRNPNQRSTSERIPT